MAASKGSRQGAGSRVETCSCSAMAWTRRRGDRKGDGDISVFACL